MNIMPTQYNVSMTGKKWPWTPTVERVEQKILDVMPERTVQANSRKLEQWKKIDHIISKPAENRAIMGATALLTQPVIDYSNRKVDKETRKISVYRTISKIIACTTVGVFCARGPVYTLVRKMTNLMSTDRFSRALLPKKYIAELASNEKYLSNYRKALATCGSFGVMLFTNFLLDAPWTAKLTNKCIDWDKQRKEKNNA